MSSTSREYGKALKALREREVFELQLNQSNYSFEAFSAYLDWEQSSAPKIQNPRLAQTLFERTLIIHWQQRSTWEDYVYHAVRFFNSYRLKHWLRLDSEKIWCRWGHLDSRAIHAQLSVERRSLGILSSIPRSTGRLPARKHCSTKRQSNFDSMAFGTESRDGEILLRLAIHMSLSSCRLGRGDQRGWLSGKWARRMSREDGDRYSREFYFLSNLFVAFESSEQYYLGKLIIHIKTLSSKPDEARTIWNLMSKAHTSRCDYWLDRIVWERQGSLSHCSYKLEDKDSFEYAMICSKRTCRKSSMTQDVSVLHICPF